MAARTEVTPAKAFPQQDTGGGEPDARDRSSGPRDTTGDTPSTGATERPPSGARATPQRDRSAREVRPRGASDGRNALAARKPTPPVPAEPVTSTPAEPTATTPAQPTSTSPAEPLTTNPAETVAPVKAGPAVSRSAGSESTKPVEPVATDPAEAKATDPAEPVAAGPAVSRAGGSGSAKPVEVVSAPVVETTLAGKDVSAPAGSNSGAPEASDATPEPVPAAVAAEPTAAELPTAGEVEPTAAVVEPTGEPADDAGQSSAVLAAVQSAAVQVRRTAKDTWSRVAADPARTPELLALTAVQVIGPRAATWARDVRESYPTAGADGIARLAIRQFTRRGGMSSALAAVSGAYAPVALVGTAAYHHAELVLHVAAAYGVDPADPARAADLLVLTRVHPGREEAEAAIAAAVATGRGDKGAATTRRLGRTLAVQAGGWAALRAVSRRFPGSALLVAAITSRAATETLGVRATTFYRSAVR